MSCSSLSKTAALPGLWCQRAVPENDLRTWECSADAARTAEAPTRAGEPRPRAPDASGRLADDPHRRVRRPLVRRLAPAAVPIRVRGRGGPGGTIQDDHRRRAERAPPDAPRARLADRRLALLAGRGRHRGRRDGGAPRPRGARRDDHGGPELLHLLHPADGDGVHRLVVLVPALRDGRPPGGAPVRLVWPRRRPGDRGRRHGVDPARPDPPRAAPVRGRRARPDGGLPRDPAPLRRRRRRHGGARELLRRSRATPGCRCGRASPRWS